MSTDEIEHEIPFNPDDMPPSTLFAIPRKAVIKSHIIRLVSRLCNIPENEEPLANDTETPLQSRKRSFEEMVNQTV